MRSMLGRALLSAGALALLTGGAAAKVGDKVKVVGCAKKVEPVCVIIGDKKGSYSVGSAVPAVPTDNRAVMLTGKVAGDFSFCGATPLTDIKWVPVKMKCPKAK